MWDGKLNRRLGVFPAFAHAFEQAGGNKTPSPPGLPGAEKPKFIQTEL